MKRLGLFLILVACAVPVFAGPFGFFGKTSGGCANGQCNLPADTEWRHGGKTNPTITATLQKVQAGQQAILQWTTDPDNTDHCLLNGNQVANSGQKEVYPSETTAYVLMAFNGRGQTESSSVTISVVPADTSSSTLSAIGIGSAFSISTPLSRAANSHDLAEFIKAQSGSWAVIDPLMLKADHPKVLDKWVDVLKASGKTEPAVIWYSKAAGVVTIKGIDQLADSTADLLPLAKRQLPVAKTHVTIKGKTHGLGLKPAKKGVKSSIKSVEQILTPLAVKDYPIGVDLRNQFRYRKDQGQEGTCYAQAPTALEEAAIYRCFGPRNAIELSANNLAAATDGSNGGYAANTIGQLMKVGVVPQASQPNYVHRMPAGWRLLAANYRALGVYGPPSSNTIGYVAAGLAKGLPSTVGISVGNGFSPDSKGRITFAQGSGYGVNHEVVIAGGFFTFEDMPGKRFVLLVNSWGRDWGFDGMCYLEDKFLDDGDTDFWVIVVPNASSNYQFDSPAEKAGVTLEVPVEAIVGKK